MEAVISEILRPVVKILTDHLVRKLRYLTYRKKYVEDMGNKKNDLIAKRNEVQKHICNHNISSQETPVTVKVWMEKVEKVEKEAETISRTHIGCSNITTWYEVGKDAFNALKTINDLIIEYPGTSWNRIRIPLGHVDSSTSAPASSSSGGETKSDYDSRDKLFKEALKFLQQDDPTRVIALCGMGGVGKTTMMKRLRKHAEDTKMFNQIVNAVIGKDRDMLSVQRDIEAYTGGPLTDQQGVTAKAECLRIRFEDMLKAGKKILVILDDVWEKIELKNIGLWSPLPNGVKLLLTSRLDGICNQIAADVLSVIEVVKVGALVEEEARKLFFKSIDLEAVDDDRYEIGCGIVQKCGCLPLAIKIIAGTLLHKEKSEWVSTLECLKNKDLTPDLKGIIEVSYEALGNEEREILLLCGMHPEDSNIKIEDLTRYAWGLGLVKKTRTFMYARRKTEKWVSNLKSANLLMNSDGNKSGCVKMHDLVLAFVVDSVSKGEDEWIIEHGDRSDWNKVRMSESCKRISLSCWGMSDFPSDLKFQNLSVLKLLDGASLWFPPDFYEEMKKLEVIGYKRMKYPLLPTSSQYTPNLRTLCLDSCFLSYDYSCIGNLRSLEVLSFAKSNIRKLPSTFQNLKKLRLLDVTDCSNLVIDDGVLGNLGELEELYAGVDDNNKGISFTDRNNDELAEISENLYALEIGFQSQSPAMLSEKLERFKISVDMPLKDSKKMQWESDEVSYRNTLMFNTSKERLQKTRMNKLFEKTENLYLAIDGMEHLEDIDVHPPHPSSSFRQLRFLAVKECGKSRYLFTLNVAIALSRLEKLWIAKCPVMESIIHIEGNGAQTITFPELRNLRLVDLPELSCLCNNVNEIQLPRLLGLKLSGLSKFTSIYTKNELATSLLNTQVVVPMLENLYIKEMENLKEIWPFEYGVAASMLKSIQVRRCDSLVNLFPSNCTSILSQLEELEVNNCASLKKLFNMDTEGSSVLRRIEARECKSLVNLFPSNPMSLLHHLEMLTVVSCASIETLFDIDLDRVYETEDGSSMLKWINVSKLGKLREIWKVRGFNDDSITVIGGFQAVESIYVQSCESFENVYTPTNANFDMRSLVVIQITNFGGSRRNNNLEIDCMPEEEISSVGDNVLNVAFPSYSMHNFHHLHNLILNDWKRVEVVFEIESGSSKELAKTQQQLLLPFLKDIHLQYMEKMSHVWKCNWNEFLILQKQPFRNLTTIELSYCYKIKYLFSPLMVKLLSNLKKIKIENCDCMEEVVSNMDDINDEEMPISPSSSSSTQTIPTLFPHLDSISLRNLENLKRIGGGEGGRNEISSINTTTTVSNKVCQVDVLPWSLCQYSREIHISCCRALSSVIPSYALGHMQNLEVLKIKDCNHVIEVFETEGINNIADGSTSNNVAEGINDTDPTLESPRPKNINNVPQLLNLKEVHIHGCMSFRHVFTFSALESLKQLEKLEIRDCWGMEVIVKEENGEQTEKDVVFPRLKSIRLYNLTKLEGFFLGMNAFLWESLESVHIRNCHRIRLFTTGRSTAPMLNFIEFDDNKYSLEQGLNFEVTTTDLDQTRIPSLCPATSEGKPWSFHNLIEIYVCGQHDVKHIIPSNELLQLQKLENIRVSRCDLVEEVFEVALEGTNSDFNESPTTAVEIPNLREVELMWLSNLKCIWKSNQSAVLQFPNLTKLSIWYCDSLKHVLTSSMVGSLPQLQALHLGECNSLEVIVKEEEVEEESDHGKVNEITLPCLESLMLENLPSLKGFCLGHLQAFSLPLLDTLNIYECPALTVFTMGDLNTPKLNVIVSISGLGLGVALEYGSLVYVKEDLNSVINTGQQEGFWKEYDSEEYDSEEAGLILKKARLHKGGNSRRTGGFRLYS